MEENQSNSELDTYVIERFDKRYRLNFSFIDSRLPFIIFIWHEKILEKSNKSPYFNVKIITMNGLGLWQPIEHWLKWIHEERKEYSRKKKSPESIEWGSMLRIWANYAFLVSGGYEQIPNQYDIHQNDGVRWR